MKWENPVSVANKMVVLMGVRVTQELMAAMQLIIANVGSIDGSNTFIIIPNTAPTKNKGMMKPPLQPDVTVTEMAIILNTNKRMSTPSDQLCARTSLSS